MASDDTPEKVKMEQGVVLPKEKESVGINLYNQHVKR